MNTNKWILKNGASTQEFDSFPYAFRTMYAIVKKAVETKNSDTVIKGLSIISPQKDNHGDPRKYNYAAATQMATASGLLTPEGTINSREFKRR
jgi:hypothetical protein